MSTSSREATRLDIPADGKSIPMMAQVYVRARNRLRELETLLQEPPLAILSDEGADEQPTERKVLEAQAAALRVIAENALVVPISARAIVGSVVHARTGEDAPLERYEIVVSTEVDPAAGKVSFDSPIGKALMGREVGEVAVVETPRGKRELQVMVIKHE